MNRNKALQVIATERSGDIQSLEKEIGIRLLKEFEVTGLIIRGNDKTGVGTWRASNFTSKLWDRFDNITFADNLLGFFLGRFIKA